MKFAVKLKKRMIPEWQDAYLNYELLKTLLKPFRKTSKLCSKILDHKMKVLKAQVSFDEIDAEDLESLKEFEARFQSLLFSEVGKINTFFHMKLLDFKREWEIIKFNCLLFVPQRHNNLDKKQGKEIKNAIFIFYKKLDFLMEYMNLNMEGVRKVLKKHRKICKTFAKNIEILDAKPKQLFMDSYITENSELLLRLMDEVKKIYIFLFYNKFNKHKGHKDLQELTKTRIISVWDSHFYFFFSGCTLILLIVIIFMGWYGDVDPDDEETFKYIFPIFRGAAFIIIYIWLLGWNVYGWTRYHVNYKRIFKFNYHFSPVRVILMRGTVFASIFLIIFIWYIIMNEKMERISDPINSMDQTYIPIVIWIALIIYMLAPPPFFNWEGRKYFFKLMFRIFFLSFCVLDFTMSWATDQMVSFVTPIKDLEYTFCYYISRFYDNDEKHPSECYQTTFLIGFMAAFVPVFYRMVQCTRSLANKRKILDPDLLNFFKYFATLLTSIFSFLVGKYKNENDFVYIWIVFAAISAIYSYIWDIKMDWGLMESNKKLKYRFLREKLIYPRVYFYYFAIFVNLFLRFAWILTISPGLVSKIMRPELFTLIIGSLEMFRRAIWNFLRVEKEFILNTENYQALENYTLPYNYDPSISVDDNIKQSLKVKLSNLKGGGTATLGEAEEEFKRNFTIGPVKKGSDLQWPLLKPSVEDNAEFSSGKKVEEKNAKTSLKLRRNATMTDMTDEDIILKMEQSYNRKYHNEKDTMNIPFHKLTVQTREQEPNTTNKDSEEEEKNPFDKKNSINPIQNPTITTEKGSTKYDEDSSAASLALKRKKRLLEKEVDDEELKEQLQMNLSKFKEYLENYTNVNQEIRGFYSRLNLKYDETGRRESNERESMAGTAMGYLLEKIVSVKSNFMRPSSKNT